MQFIIPQNEIYWMNSLSEYIISLRPQKVALISSMYPPYPDGIQPLWGGIEIDIEDLVTSLEKKSIQTYVISLHYCKPVDKKEVDIDRIGTYIPYILSGRKKSLFYFWYKELFRPLIFLRLIRVLKKRKPNIVVIGKTYQLSLAIYIACHLLNLPYIVRYDWTCPSYPKEEPCTIRSAFDCPDCIEKTMGVKVPKLFKVSAPLYFVPLFFLKRYFWNKSKRVSVVSEHYRGIIESFGVNSNKIMIDPPTSRLQMDENELKRITLLYKKKNEYIILFVGRIESEKGILLLLDALTRPILQMKKFKIIIIGTGSLAEVVTAASQQDKRIVYLGAIPHSQIGNYYALTDLVIIPSIVPESYGLVAIEAMSIDKPIVGFNLGGLKELLSDYKQGILIEEINADDLAHAINKFFTSR
jgi:glycosyltransferase involved in cell wall biosynthesis